MSRQPRGKKRQCNEFQDNCPPAKRRQQKDSRLEAQTVQHLTLCTSQFMTEENLCTVESRPIVPQPSVFSRLGPPSETHQSTSDASRNYAGIEQSDPGGHKVKSQVYSSLTGHRFPRKRKYTAVANKQAAIILPLNDDQYLHELANSEPRKLTELLNKREKELKELLSSKTTTSEGLTLTLLVKIFAKLCAFKLLNDGSPCMPYSYGTSERDKARVTGIMRFLIDEDTLGGFYTSLSSYLCKMPIEANISKRKELLPILTDTIAMFNVLLDLYPGPASRSLSVIDTCVCTAAQLAQQQIIFQEVSEKVKRLLQKRNDIRAQSYESNCENPHTQEFSVILPSPEELHKDMLTLQKNIISGPFPDSSSYLVIQFQLLQEDFLRPLRQALRSKSGSEEDEENENVMVYQNVCFNKGQTYTFSGMAYRISFRTPHKVNWNRSKKLQYGSLVCLSTDNFQTVRYATVVERDVEDLNNDITSIQLQGCSPDDEIALSPSTQFSMIESPGYFKAYSPVLKQLDKVDPIQLPFKHYLVDLITEVDIPTYLKDVVTDVYVDMKGIICNCHKSSQCEHENVEILNHEVWDTLKTPLPDSSQKKALHLALTQELALIQGPPGTGKTYVGLKLIETLLRNDHLWRNALSATGGLIRCPIVVICYTNHALDQFLEGILQLKSNIQVRRIGSRSKSEAISNDMFIDIAESIVSSTQ